MDADTAAPEHRDRRETCFVVFDLDDTLHDFAHAARAATDAVFRNLCAADPSLDADRMRGAYRDVCARYVGAFTDGRSAYDYRLERMQALLIAVRGDPGHAHDCVLAYAAALHEALRPEPGARATLTSLRELGYGIGVVSEGPRDAQERTLHGLHLHGLVDRVLTSNGERIAKPDGLYRRFAQSVRIDPSACTVVGDSIERDVKPARAAGMAAIHYDPRGTGGAGQAVPRISALAELPALLARAGRSGVANPSAEKGDAAKNAGG